MTDVNQAAPPGASAKTTTTGWNGRHTIIIATLLVLSVVVGLNQATLFGENLQRAWLVQAALVAGVVLMAGYASRGRLTGFMIDSRNRMSLSQFQVAAWTVLLVSAIFTVALGRVATLGQGALDIALQEDLLWLMGISTASLVGTSLVLDNKRKKKPDGGEVERAQERLARVEGTSSARVAQSVASDSILLRNAEPENARGHNLVTGDETGNAGVLDVSKVQMLLFTVVILVVYASALAEALPGMVASVTASFPELSDSLVTLLGLSHAGYLGYKAAPHTETQADG